MDRLDLSNLRPSNDPTEVLAHSPASASCLPVVVSCIPREAELTNDFHPVARVFVANEGRGRRWYRQGSRIFPMRTEPGMIEIYEKGLAFDHCRWSGEPGRCVLIELADVDVQAMTHGDLQGLALKTRHEVFDDRVSRIIFQLAGEALAGLPNGLLYAQGLSIALLG
jgi:AraC family transcriptional regulator